MQSQKQKFLELLQNKSLRVGILGLGYVGLPLVLRFSEAGFRVIDPACGSGHFVLGSFARILDRWQRDRPSFRNYESGTGGPRAADDLIHRDNRSWRRH